jgi:hypothetical protein
MHHPPAYTYSSNKYNCKYIVILLYNKGLILLAQFKVFLDNT